MHSALSVSQLPLINSRHMPNFLQCWQPSDFNQLELTREDYFAMLGDSNSACRSKLWRVVYQSNILKGTLLRKNWQWKSKPGISM